MEQLQKPAAPAAAPCSADLGHGGCALCGPGNKPRSPVTSCVQRPVSYCGPHGELPALKWQKQVDPVQSEQDGVCSRHGEAREMQGLDAVSVAPESSHRLHHAKTDLNQRLCEREKDMIKLQQQLSAIRISADSAVDLCDRSLPELTRLLAIKLEKMKQDLRALEEAKVHTLGNLKNKLEQDIAKLTSHKADLELLEETTDPIAFLHKFKPLLEFINALDYDVIRADKFGQPDLPLLCVVKSDLRDLQHKLQSSGNEDEAPPRSVAVDDDLLIHRDEAHDITHINAPSFQSPMRRHLFLQYARDLTFNPKTAHSNIVLTSENRRVNAVNKRQPYQKCKERFSSVCQVLGKEALTGRCYIELKVSFTTMYDLALTYKDIKRKGCSHDCILGHNKKSWSFQCHDSDLFHFLHHNECHTVWWTATGSDRLGIFLDHDAGILEFYAIDELKLLHEIHTTFTQPLYLAVGFLNSGDSVEICKLT